MANGAIEAYFEREKDTPGTRRFKEVTDPGVRGKIGTIYVTKDAASEDLGEMPERIKVTVEGA